MGKVTVELDEEILSNLKLWLEAKESGPRNELQSIQAWLYTAGRCKDLEELKTVLRGRMMLLLKASIEVFDRGGEEEDRLGIYDLAPEMRPGYPNPLTSEDINVVRDFAGKLKKEIFDIQARLLDPTTVHTSMLRGHIATPSLRAMIHLHGAKAMEAWDKFIEQNPEYAEVDLAKK